MRFTALLSSFCAAALVAADQRTAQIYVQPIHASAHEPQPLAEVAYDPASSSSSQVASYEAPELPEGASLVRIGLYDSKSGRWISGTTAASVDNFDKGYAPNILLSVDEQGDVRSVAYKGVQIDAGQTRDFGPQVVVLTVAKGKQPELNKPVVLSPEGKKVGEEPEKTLLQKYWWVIGIVVVMTMAGGGDK
ncbi:hypothetical protein EDB81DRAFT_790935 [Dactylonectria macrodidyma]|uniref:Cyclin-dependent protein kinase regulator pho80 n=1 Tax=Dactylonectria macrodidyma TaxID=307937 RepID=A0A9P9F5L5_9HYPO|nr:hypothetical protein EDB81DRAFT_790935 [Dactylonectria macrodidyma]